MQIYNSFQTSVRKALDEIDINWPKYEGLIICGTHSPRETDIEMLIHKIKLAREEGLPYLGICFGHQLAFIEYCKNVLGIGNATSEEFSEEGTFVVKKLPQLKVGLHDGETYWNNYECIGDWIRPENFVTCQFHPEYQSLKEKPHPILVEFINKCKKT